MGILPVAHIEVWVKVRKEGEHTLRHHTSTHRIEGVLNVDGGARPLWVRLQGGLHRVHQDVQTAGDGDAHLHRGDPLHTLHRCTGKVRPETIPHLSANDAACQPAE